MNLISGYPFWLIKNGLLFEYPKLQSDITADVVIMGGGISGALTAYYLVEAGIDCIVVDGRSIGLGSTCASTSLLQYEIDVPLWELKKKIGEQNAITSYKLCEEAINVIEEIEKKVGSNKFRKRHSLYFAARESHVPDLKKEFAAREKAGFNVQLLSPTDINTAFGFKCPAAILSESAAETDAYHLAQHIYQYCLQKGLKVFDRTLVENIVHEKDAVYLKTSAGNKIKAGKLIYATGFESVKYISKKIVSLQVTYAAISESLNTNMEIWKDNALLWNTNDPYLYMRTTTDNRIIVGGHDEKYADLTAANKMMSRKTKSLQDDFCNLFPAIDFKTEFCWAGVFGSTKDGLPYIGSYSKKPNSYFALGFGGNGITFSVIAAKMIRDFIFSGKSAHASIFAFDR